MAGALVLAGCGSDDGDSTSGPASTSADGLDRLRVSSIALCNEALPWGIDQGIFEEHGLEIEVITVQSGAAGVAGMQAGDIDVGFVNSLSVFQAVDEGVDLEVVANSGLSTEDANGVIVAAGGDYESPGDLQGATIAINQLGGLGQVLTEAWIAADAGEDSTAEFVTLPFADQVPAVESGNVDAAQVTASQVAQGEASGSTISLGNPFFDGVGAIPTALYVSTADFVEDNSDVLSRFAEAMTETAESANDDANDEARFAVLEEFCKTPAAEIAETAEPDYEGRMSMDSYESLVGVLQEGGHIDGDRDWTEIVPDFARAES